MMLKGEEMLKNLLIAGSGAAFLLSTLFATVVFDKVSPNSTAADQEIEMVRNNSEFCDKGGCTDQ
jgi:hypothetical protein